SLKFCFGEQRILVCLLLPEGPALHHPVENEAHRTLVRLHDVEAAASFYRAGNSQEGNRWIREMMQAAEDQSRIEHAIAQRQILGSPCDKIGVATKGT